MKTTATLAAATVAIALAFPTAASADSKFFNVTVGGPGYAVSVGSAGVGLLAGAPFYPAFAPVAVIAPAPVHAPVIVAPPVVYRAHRPHRVVHVVPAPLAYVPFAAPRPSAPVAWVPYRAVAPVGYVSAARY